MWQYSRFLSTSSCRWPTCGSSAFKDSFPFKGQEVAQTSTCPLGRPFALGRGILLIPGFIWSPRTLAVYDVTHSLPLGDIGRGFPSLRMRPQGISHTSLVLLESRVDKKLKSPLPYFPGYLLAIVQMLIGSLNS